MGKNLRQQRRGARRPRYLAPSHRHIGKLGYTIAGAASGKVVDLVHSTGKSTPVAIVDFGGRKELLIPAEGTHVGKTISYGGTVESGNIVEIGQIPEGTKIFNIELRPGDSGKLCRAPGTTAVIITHSSNYCVVEMPSKKQVTLNARCRATIGTPAGGGRIEKPFMKAGHKFYAMRALGRHWPRTKAVAKNPVDHPLGGKAKPGAHLTVSRYAPPGAKYGSLAPRRTGKRKK